MARSERTRPCGSLWLRHPAVVDFKKVPRQRPIPSHEKTRFPEVAGKVSEVTARALVEKLNRLRHPQGTTLLPSACSVLNGLGRLSGRYDALLSHLWEPPAAPRRCDRRRRHLGWPPSRLSPRLALRFPPSNRLRAWAACGDSIGALTLTRQPTGRSVFKRASHRWNSAISPCQSRSQTTHLHLKSSNTSSLTLGPSAWSDPISFETTVQHVEPTGDGRWIVTTETHDSPTTEIFDGVVVANGAYWNPVYPSDVRGRDLFRGVQLHSHSYKDPSPFANQTVVIAGMGLSGTEIAKELSQHGCRVVCATKRARELIALDPTLPEKVVLRPQITEVLADGVAFADGSFEACNAIIWCTGYAPSFPFLGDTVSRSILGADGRLQLYKHVFSPLLPNIAFLGFITTNGSIFPLVEAQAMWFAGVLTGDRPLPPPGEMQSDIAAWSGFLDEYDIHYRTTEVITCSYLADLYNRMGLLDDPRFREYAKYLQ